MKQLRTESEIITSWKDNLHTPIVSFCCITYNHEHFINDTIKGFLMQKTNFAFEILIHDDASTDRTTDIIQSYKEKYPKIIKTIFQTENQWTKTNDLISKFVLPETNGIYIALCEGDDYWTNPYKIKKQVQFLENNKNISFCFHNAIIHDTINDEIRIFNKFKNKKIFTIEDITKENFVHTGSVITRKENFYLLPKLNYRVIDWVFHICSAKKSNFAYLPEIMSTYRIHQGGVWSGQNANTRALNAINYSFRMNDFTQKLYQKNFFANILNILINYKITFEDVKSHKHLFENKHYTMLLYFYKQLLELN